MDLQLEDLSKYGSFVNGTQLETKQKLHLSNLVQSSSTPQQCRVQFGIKESKFMYVSIDGRDREGIYDIFFDKVFIILFIWNNDMIDWQFCYYDCRCDYVMIVQHAV